MPGSPLRRSSLTSLRSSTVPAGAALRQPQWPREATNEIARQPHKRAPRRLTSPTTFFEAHRIADRVVIGQVFQKQSDTVAAAQMFSPEQLVDDLRAAGISAELGADAAAISRMVAAAVAPQDVIVLMSNGDFGGLRARLVEALAHRAAAHP